MLPINSGATESTLSQTQQKTIERLLLDAEQLIDSDIPQAQRLIDVIASQLKNSNNTNQHATLNNLQAYIYILTRQYERSLKHLKLSNKISLATNNRYELAESIRLEAVLYSITNLPEESIILFLEALSIHRELQSEKVINSLQGISLYYRNKEAYKEYQEYGELILDHPITKTSKKYQGIAQYTIGEGLLKQGHYERARVHLLASITSLASISSAWISEVHITLAELELLTGENEKALEIVSASKIMAQQHGYLVAQTQADLLIARIYQAMGDNDQAVSTLTILLPNAIKYKDQVGEQKVHQMLAQLFEQSENFEAALYHQKSSKRIDDDIHARSQQAKSMFHRARLDSAQQEQQIKQLTNKQVIHTLQREQSQRTSMMRDIIIALFILILICLVYYAVRVRRVKEEMERLATQAQSANNAKSNFLAKMSHEIRTPMNAIIGLSQLTLKEKLSPKQRDNITMVHASSQSLLTLLNDILDFSKIEAEKLELEHAEFLLSNSFERLLNVCNFSAQEKQLSLNINIDSDVPNAFLGDALRLEQILINLVNNAIKFTEQGDITIQVALTTKTISTSTLAFSVKDKGIGIADEQLDRLFKAFSQTDNSVTRRYGGTGLGLVICKELVELMAGDISVTSELGKGSCFSFNVTLANDTRREKASSQSGEVSLHKLKVLIVDDSMSSRTLLADMLKNIGIDAQLAHGGVAALEILRQAITAKQAYDVVLMDWRMPGLDGFESIRLINQVVAENLPHFILISSFDKRDAIELSHQTPVADILEKPVKMTQLTASLTKLYSQPSAILAESTSEPVININPLRILLAEDNLINQHVIRGFLEDLNITIDAVENGLLAIKAVQFHDYDMVLMDVQMPEIDGLNAAKIMREQLHITIPIIAMTAHSTKQDIENSLAAGMNVHLTKPVDSSRLISVIEEYRMK